MITKDQPTELGQVLVRISSRSDGTQLDRAIAVHDPATIKRRQAFCGLNNISYDDVVYQRIIYGEDRTYDVIVDVDTHSTTKHIPEIVADGLFTEHASIGLFLPVADCVATVLFDPRLRYLAQLHLGRHSTLSDLLPRMLAKFEDEGSDLSELMVWMSPSAQRASYKLDHFSLKDDPSWRPYCDKTSDGIFIDMQGYNRARIIEAGVSPKHIFVSPINTMTDKNYFSHANGEIHDRMAVLAMMTES